MCLFAPAHATAQRPDVHLIYMGGTDCPPCRAWRGIELPRLQASPWFQQIRFSHVEKTIPSSVPPRWALPVEVRPLKAMLDEASGGLGGSAQVALVVNGQVYDYYYGYRDAGEVERMIRAVLLGEPYPFERCLRRGGTTHFLCDRRPAP